MSGFIERERDATMASVLAWHNTCRVCWRSACGYEGLDPVEPFAVLSERNPYAAFLATAHRHLAESRAALSHFGYGGLVLEGGKGVLHKTPRASRAKKSRLAAANSSMTKEWVRLQEAMPGVLAELPGVPGVPGEPGEPL